MVAAHRIANKRKWMREHKANLAVIVIAAAVAYAIPSSAQILHPEGPLPSFEVASIRHWKAVPLQQTNGPIARVQSAPHVGRLSSDRIHFIGQLDLLIMEAYNLPVGSDRRIKSGPRWIHSEAERYEVNARIDPSMFVEMQKMTPQRQQQQVELLKQSLLADRFHLRVHFETAGDTAVFALVVAPEGSKLTPSKQGELAKMTFHDDQITARATSVSEFVASPFWTPVGTRSVADQTGLTGTYDFTLKWRPDGPLTSEEQDLPPLFDAIRDQLGLQVKDSKMPLEVIVIDRVERPTVN